ncbi:MAG: response regulator transcription factor [Elusimicrobia bacterium]|nr:response regulator transcription factor [Elusimicrobiota bacterium]
MTNLGSTKILVIEDDYHLRHITKLALQGDGFTVLESANAKDGVQIFENEAPGLILLDLKLPDQYGLEICKRVRAHPKLSTTPIIILTSESDIEKKITGLTAGADQYLTKPIPTLELVAWVKALLRRLDYSKEGEGTLRCGDLSVDPQAHLVKIKDRIIGHLTRKEFDLLYLLVKKRPQIISRKYVLSKLWHEILVDRVVDVHIGHLREKLGPDLGNKIETVPGKGYRFWEQREPGESSD